MELLEIGLHQVLDDEIRSRHIKSSLAQYTQHFLARVNGEEVGFLSVDMIPEYENFIVYEIFVPARLRRRGFGAQLLHAAETMAQENGYVSSLLMAKTLNNDFAQEDLEAWYRRRGYESGGDDLADGRFIKKLKGESRRQ